MRFNGSAHFWQTSNGYLRKPNKSESSANRGLAFANPLHRELLNKLLRGFIKRLLAIVGTKAVGLPFKVRFLFTIV